MVGQAASTEADQAQQQEGAAETVSRTLHIQAAKVVTAHAASIGDPLLGIPLLCSAGAASQSQLPWQSPLLCLVEQPSRHVG